MDWEVDTSANFQREPILPQLIFVFLTYLFFIPDLSLFFEFGARPFDDPSIVRRNKDEALKINKTSRAFSKKLASLGGGPDAKRRSQRKRVEFLRIVTGDSPIALLFNLSAKVLNEEKRGPTNLALAINPPDYVSRDVVELLRADGALPNTVFLFLLFF